MSDHLPRRPWRVEPTVMEGYWCILAEDDEVIARCQNEDIATSIAGIPNRDAELDRLRAESDETKTDLAQMTEMYEALHKFYQDDRTELDRLRAENAILNKALLAIINSDEELAKARDANVRVLAKIAKEGE